MLLVSIFAIISSRDWAERPSQLKDSTERFLNSRGLLEETVTRLGTAESSRTGTRLRAGGGHFPRRVALVLRRRRLAFRRRRKKDGTAMGDFDVIERYF